MGKVNYYRDTAVGTPTEKLGRRLYHATLNHWLRYHHPGRLGRSGFDKDWMDTFRAFGELVQATIDEETTP